VTNVPKPDFAATTALRLIGPDPQNWLTAARMNLLRTPKNLPGPEPGIPALSFQSWYEARYGEAAYAAIDHCGAIFHWWPLVSAATFSWPILAATNSESPARSRRIFLIRSMHRRYGSRPVRQAGLPPRWLVSD
jgi:hypothetical protein